MKSVLLSLSFIFSLLFTMVSCQSQGSRSFATHEEIRDEILYRNDYRIEQEAARLMKTASQTKSIHFIQPKFN